MDNLRILSIGAHPDDIEYGCAGTIKKLSKDNEVFFLVVTKGDKGGDPVLRKEEQLKSSKILGVTKTFFGEFQDTNLKVENETISYVEKVIEECKPDIVFTHFGEDTHQDHRALYSIVNSAARHVKSILYFEGPTTFNFMPLIFTDISKTVGYKIKSLEAHHSQVHKTNIDGTSILDLASACANFRGTKCKVKCGEGFTSSRFLLIF